MSEYTPPPQSPPPPPPETPNMPQGFFQKLFDIRFSSYVTPSIITVLYVLGMVAIALAYLFYVIVAFDANAGFGIVTLLIIGPIFSLLALIWLRVTLEFYLALVRLSGDFRQFREEWRQRP